MGSETRWWRAREGQEYNVLLAALQDAYSTSSTRLDSYARGLRFYADKIEVYIGRDPAHPASLDFNLVRTLAQTARSHLVEYAAPRPLAQTSGGDWELQEQAHKLTKWFSGAIATTKFDALARGKVALRSAVLGTGALKYENRFDRIHVSAPKPWHLFAHEEDEQAGEVRTLYHCETVDKGVLAHLYPRHAKKIDQREGDSILPWALGMTTRGSGHRCAVIEAWHLPSSPDAKDGRHIVAIEGQILLDEPWRDPDFPLTFFQWSEPLSGWWASGIADEVGALQWRINKLVTRLQEAIDLTCNPRLLVPRGSKVSPWPPTNESGAICYYTGPKAPEWDVARAVSPEISAQIERLWAKGFQMVGESEMAAMAMKPAGIDSGEAIRAYAQKTSGRRAPWSINQKDVYRDSGVQFKRLGARISEANPDFDVVYQDEDRKSIERIKFSEIDLDEDSYIISVGVVSSLPEDPAGRQAALDERMKLGFMTPRQYLRLQRSADLEADDALESAPYDLIRDNLQRMTYGDGTYSPPQPMDDLKAALDLVTKYYAKARRDNVSPDRLAMLRQYAKAVQVEAKKLLPPAPPGAPAALPPAPPAGPEAAPPPTAM